MTQKQISDWTWGESIKQAHQRLEQRGLKRMLQPTQDYQDLGDIEHIENVGDHTLANMLTRHLAWYSYATVELAYSRAALSSLTELYDVELGEEMNNVAKTKDSRVVKDVLKGIAVQQSERLTMIYRKRLELIQDVSLLEGMVNGLSIRAKACESEAIRRASTRKIEGGSIL